MARALDSDTTDPDLQALQELAAVRVRPSGMYDSAWFTREKSVGPWGVGEVESLKV